MHLIRAAGDVPISIAAFGSPGGGVYMPEDVVSGSLIIDCWRNRANAIVESKSKHKNLVVLICIVWKTADSVGIPRVRTQYYVLHTAVDS